MRLAAAGEAILIGSRTTNRAHEAAGKIRAAVPGAQIEAAENVDALRRADRAVLAVPFDGLEPFLDGERLAGKLIVDVVVPLTFTGGFCDVRRPAGAASVGELIQARAPGARVVSAFKNIPAARLQAMPSPVEGDCLLCGDDPQARAEVAALVGRIPNLRPIDAGDLRVARHLEALTALQINLNRHLRGETAVRILGLPPPV
jgi:hypothetical protein